MAEPVAVSVTVNGTVQSSDVEPRLLLVHYLRDTLGLTGTHVGCDTSNCGACTVLVDGVSVKSCTVLAVQADGAEVTTIEGMAAGDGPASAAGGVLGRARPAVRLLHPGHDHGRRRPAPAQPGPVGGGDPRTGSPATCAAARATTTSSRPSSTPRDCRRTPGCPSPPRPSRASSRRRGRAHERPGQRRQRPRRAPDAAQGGPAAHPGQGPLRRRHHRARRPVGELRALPRGARHDRLDRRLGRARAPGRRRGLHRRGPRPRRARCRRPGRRRA